MLSETDMLLPQTHVTDDNWESVKTHLPADLARGLHFERNCWTFYRDPEEVDGDIPLRIGSAPVIVPVWNPPIIHAGTIPPPDPYPERINPEEPISNTIALEIFETFPLAHGFYILFNGFLQLLVDDGFNFQKAMSAHPREFGCLKVSFIPSGPRPLQNMWKFDNSWKFENMWKSRKGPLIVSQSVKKIPEVPPLVCGGDIDVRLKHGVKRSCIGVAVRINGREYATMASHAAIDIPEQMKKSRLRWPIRRRKNKQGAVGKPWWEDVAVYASNTDQKLQVKPSIRFNQMIS